jgi:hypothetical protein
MDDQERSRPRAQRRADREAVALLERDLPDRWVLDGEAEPPGADHLDSRDVNHRFDVEDARGGDRPAEGRARRDGARSKT